MLVHLIEKYDQKKSQLIFNKYYSLKNNSLNKGAPKIENVISGKLEYLKMVKGSQDSTYIKLKVRFDNCFTKKKKDHAWNKKIIERSIS